ncbi:hypothetical protein E4N80_08710 [Treponema denticola]|uniref:Uncharacterized protein n=2 Tax=Treponema denticola TaxID=158 RepID=A0A9Q9EXG3_TREDN|nr:hypothetical protein [Treponema denticola]UTC89925.1 hypothetical protein E4N87_04120 [Treponema denticola]UTD00724.1 hypothetical protein E4N86_08460 [Treponema denticola]UTD05554.1 hypothetical protein E4N80_08710 [Treponema denticola]
MYNKFQSNQRSSVDENMYEDKTPEQIFIEKRAELFLNAAKKNPKTFIYRLKRSNLKFKYIKTNFYKNK